MDETTQSNQQAIPWLTAGLRAAEHRFARRLQVRLVQVRAWSHPNSGPLLRPALRGACGSGSVSVRNGRWWKQFIGPLAAAPTKLPRSPDLGVLHVCLHAVEGPGLTQLEEKSSFQLLEAGAASFTRHRESGALVHHVANDL